MPENRFLTLSLANNLLFILSILKKCLFLQPIKIVLTLKTIIKAEQASATKKKKSKTKDAGLHKVQARPLGVKKQFF